MSKLNRVLWSGLVLVGAAACGDDVTVAPPPEPPTGVRSVTVTPDGATIAVGATLTFSAAVTLEPGSPAATVTWATSNTAIATISATGVATGVAAGSVGITATATSGTSSAQGSATLTVSSTPTVTPATVSIQSIEQGGVPQNLNNLDGQVDVRVNLDRGGEQVQTVQLLIDGTVVTEQVFASPPAQATAPETVIEEIVFSWNTAAFDSATGAVKHLNGPHAVAAKVITAENASGTGSPNVNVVLDNSNTAVIKLEISNGADATDSDGLLWYTGDARASATPVIYTTATPTIGNVVFNPTSLNTQVDATAPYSVVWAKGTAIGDDGSGGNGLPGVEDDEFDVCVTAVVNGNPVNLDCLSDFDAEIRYDNDAPGAPVVVENPNGRQAGWLNDAASFATINSVLTPNGMIALPLPAAFDGGVGGDAYTGRVGATLAAAIAAEAVESPAGIAPSATGQTYCLALYAEDALGNRSADPVAPCDTGDLDNSTLIGVDRAPPTIAYTAGSLANQARQSGPTIGGELIVTVTDTGAVGNSGVLQPIPVVSTVIRRSADGTQFTGAVGTDCVQGLEAGAPLACLPSSTGLVYAAPLASTAIGGLTGATTHGYYTHAAAAVDGAGNSTALPSGRVFVYDATPAIATAPAVPAVIGAGFVAAAFLNDDLSIRDYTFKVTYATGLITPAVINLGTPTVVDAFNAATLSTINFGVNANVSAFLGLQATVGGVPSAYAPGSDPLSQLNVLVRDQAQPAYTESPATLLAPTAPPIGIPVTAPGPNPPAFTFNTYVLATSQAAICAGTLPAGCAAVPTSTSFSATASGTTGSFNNPFTRVDFYAQNNGATTLVLIGSVSAAAATLTDDGLNRAWKYTLPSAAGALYTTLGGISPAVLGPVNVYAFGVSASGLVALVSEPVAQTINP